MTTARKKNNISNQISALFTEIHNELHPLAQSVFAQPYHQTILHFQKSLGEFETELVKDAMSGKSTAQTQALFQAKAFRSVFATVFNNQLTDDMKIDAIERFRNSAPRSTLSNKSKALIGILAGALAALLIVSALITAAILISPIILAGAPPVLAFSGLFLGVGQSVGQAWGLHNSSRHAHSEAATDGLKALVRERHYLMLAPKHHNQAVTPSTHPLESLSPAMGNYK